MTKSTLPPKPTRTAKDEAIDAVTKPEKPEMTRISADIPLNLHRQIKSDIGAKGIKLNTLIVQLFTDYLENQSK